MRGPIAGVLVLCALAGLGCGKEDDEDDELDPMAEGDPSSAEPPPASGEMPGPATGGSDASAPVVPPGMSTPGDPPSGDMRPTGGFDPRASLDGGIRFPERPGRGDAGRDEDDDGPDRERGDAGRGRPGPGRGDGFPGFDRDAGRPPFPGRGDGGSGFPGFDRDAGRPTFPGRGDGGRPRPGGGPRGGSDGP